MDPGKGLQRRVLNNYNFLQRLPPNGSSLGRAEMEASKKAISKNSQP